MKIGYTLSSEEFPAQTLIDLSAQAEAAGYDYIYLHQIGPDQVGFFKFFKSILHPLIKKL